MADELGLQVIEKRKVALADKSEIEAGVSFASVEIEGREEIVWVRIFDVSEPLIGTFTLEALGLAMDPVSGELKTTRSFITRA